MRGLTLAVVGVLVCAPVAAVGAGDRSGRSAPTLVFVSVRSHSDLGLRAAEFPNLFRVREDGRDLRRLTRVREANFDPVWSPDGRTIAFSRGVGTECHGGDCMVVPASVIWVVGADGTHARRVTRLALETTPSGQRVPFVDGSPTWSPDGRQIAFIRDLNDRNDYVGRPSARDGIYAIGVNGRGLHRLAGVVQATSLDWSPDGSTIAFVFSQRSTVGLLDLKSRRVRQIGPGMGVSWSPDGRWLAIARDSGIYLVRVQGGAVRRVTITGATAVTHVGRVSWSPDVRRLAFSATTPGRLSPYAGSPDFDIYTVGIDGRGLRRVTDNPWSDLQPDWRP